MLENKRFLFVDDDLQSIFYFRKGLVKQGAKPENVISVDNLRSAIEKIREIGFDLILIDLYCAPSCPELKIYEAKLGNPEFNQGQLLGLWLDDNYPNLKYGYITQIPGLANPINSVQASKPIFNKHKLTSADFVIKVLDLLSDNINTDVSSVAGSSIVDTVEQSAGDRKNKEKRKSIDFVLITALPEELDALLNKLPDYRKLPPTNEDIRTYYEAEIPFRFPDNTSGSYKVIVMSLLGMGRIQAAMATADAIQSWSPRYVILIGIAGGIKSRGVKIGDVLVSDQVVDYEQQKITPTGQEVRWEVQRADARMLNATNNYTNSNWKAKISITRPGAGASKIHVGPIASGDKVVAFGEIMIKYKSVWPKLIGVEMEASGAATAVFQSPEKPGFFMIRGVSDLADENKNTKNVEKWRSYACEVAAAFLVSLLQSGPIPLVSQDQN